MPKTPHDENRARKALLAFMEAKNLKAHPWAKSAGLRSSTLYNFLSGRTHSLTTDTLSRLAREAGVGIDDLLNVKSSAPKETEAAAPVQTTGDGQVAIRWLVGIFGRLYPMETELLVERPVGIPAGIDIVAARIDGDGLHPIPPDWLVFFAARAQPAETLIGKLCVVRMRGASQPMVREIRRSAKAGLYTLLSWSASPLEEVEVIEAHLVLSITQG